MISLRFPNLPKTESLGFARYSRFEASEAMNPPKYISMYINTKRGIYYYMYVFFLKGILIGYPLYGCFRK